MEVKINKEIREYTEGIFLGLSLRQCFFSFLACVMAVIFYFLFIDHLGMEITSWLCMISAAPFAALGFIRFQGMNAEQIVICAIRSLLIKQHNLIFKPQNLYYEYLKEFLERSLLIHMIKSYERLKKQNKEKISVPKSAQDLIDIDTIYKDGIFCSKNKYSKTYRFKDINYSIASKDEKVGLFLNYSELLNSLDSSTMTKITINNRKINIKLPLKRM